MSLFELDTTCWEFLETEGLELEPTSVLFQSTLGCADVLSPPQPCQTTPTKADSSDDLGSIPFITSESPSTSSTVSSIAEFENCTLESVAADIMDEIESNPWSAAPRTLASPFSDAYDAKDDDGGGGLCSDYLRNLTCQSFSTTRTMSDASSLPETPVGVDCSTNILDVSEGSELRGLPGTLTPGRGTVAKKRGRKPSEGRCCMVPSCSKPLLRSQMYYFRRRMCESCIRQSSVLIEGREMRFCQQCSLVHPVSDFDTNKRSCRAKLQAHKARAHSKKADQPSPTKRKRPRKSSDSVAPAAAQHNPSPVEGDLAVPSFRAPLLDDGMHAVDCNGNIDFDGVYFDGASDHVDILYTGVVSEDTTPFVFGTF